MTCHQRKQVVTQELEKAFELGFDRFGTGLDGEMEQEGRVLRIFQKEQQNTRAQKTILEPSTGNRVSEGEW